MAVLASSGKSADDCHCPADHAGYYENDGKGIDRLVICTGSTAIADELMPRTYLELQTMAPHYAKLVGRRYPSADQRLEAEAFWMELQTPDLVLALFRRNCAAFLERRGRTP